MSSAAGTAVSYTVGAAADYVIDYVTSADLPSLFYSTCKWTAKGTRFGLGFSGNITTTILSKVNPKLGETSRQAQAGIAFAAAKADELATDHLFDKCYREFTPAELTGPVLFTAFSGWMAAKSVHRLAKDVTMLATGQRIETVQQAKHEKPGVRVNDGVYKPHSGRSLGVSAVRNLILAPIFAGMGYLTEQGIVNRLTEIHANSLPVPYITLTAAAIYAAVQTYAWLKTKENADSISVEITSDPVPTEGVEPELHETSDMVANNRNEQISKVSKRLR